MTYLATLTCFLAYSATIVTVYGNNTPEGQTHHLPNVEVLEAQDKDVLRHLLQKLLELEERQQEQAEGILHLEEQLLDQKSEILRLETEAREQRERFERRLEGESQRQISPALQSHRFDSKRADDTALGQLEPVVNELTNKVTVINADLDALKTSTQQLLEAKGSTYVRWGNSGCPSQTELVYTGILAGAHFNDTGSGGNHLCLTSHPVFDGHQQPSANGYATIYGSEYQNCPELGCDTTPACAVCRVPRASIVMIPGTRECASGWTTEYSGYIMANNPLHTGTSEYICVDSAHVPYPGSLQVSDDENVIVYTHVKCGALPCPPYQQEHILLCTVCSK